MLSKFLTPNTLRSAKGLGQICKSGVRFMATIQTNSIHRMPQVRPKGTPVSRERATFTIKVRYDPTYHVVTHRHFIRMAQSTMARVLAPKPTFPEKPSFQLHLSDILKL